MANTSRVNGFRVVKHLNGSPYTGQANLYYVASATDEMFVGDIVKIAGSADTNGIATVQLAAASDVPCGVIVGIMHSKFDPVGKMNTGSVALDLPQVSQIAASGAAYVMVADAPDVIMEVEANTGGTALAAVDVGLNGLLALGTRTASVTTCPSTWDTATAPAATSTYMLQLLGFVQRVGNEIGASAKVLVRFNVHQFQSVGTTGL